jgi:hypothetical protein
MITPFKFFQKNSYKEKCRLQIGSTFIFQGYYSIVTRMWGNWFEFIVQETGRKCYMEYKHYLTTPSAAGRQLNRKW